MRDTAASSDMPRPESAIDLWTEDALRDPYELWRELRDIAPAVYLTRYGIWAVARYKEVAECLQDWESFSSASGVALNDRMNELLAGGTLCSDPPRHELLRGIIRRPLASKEVKGLEPEIQREAHALVERLLEQGTFDAVRDLAHHLPLTVVSKLVGLPEDGRENMLDWAAATFNCLGPMNDRAKDALPTFEDGVHYSFDPTLPERLVPGGWAARIYEAADRGEIDHGECAALLNDYWGPSLDTTIFATASAIWLFGHHPEQWDLLRSNRELMPHAINEVIRLESPIPHFSRKTTTDREIGGVLVPAGSRVLMMYGSANRDERKWSNPEVFDIRRRPGDHLGFGRGEHQCVGQPLARLEIKALLTALADRVERFELGEPTPALNNMLRGIGHLEVTAREAPRATVGRA